jgi:DNA-binding XRE family transcriptional regulator
MDYDSIINLAKENVQRDEQLAKSPFFVETIAWFHYLGLLRHNIITPVRHHPHLNDVLKAGELEPRIFELLPAVMILIPEAIQFKKQDIPLDLAQVIKAIQTRSNAVKAFRGVPAQKYCHWLHAPVMDVARRRLDYRRTPRRRNEGHGSFAEVIRSGRLRLSLTQKAFAEKYNVSLKVLRDLEQGKTTASLGTVISILTALGRTLRV